MSSDRPSTWRATLIAVALILLCTAGVVLCQGGWREPWSLDLGEWETEDENPVEKRDG